jgi:hypothetical protein
VVLVEPQPFQEVLLFYSQVVVDLEVKIELLVVLVVLQEELLELEVDLEVPVVVLPAHLEHLEVVVLVVILEMVALVVLIMPMELLAREVAAAVVVDIVVHQQLIEQVVVVELEF